MMFKVMKKTVPYVTFAIAAAMLCGCAGGLSSGNGSTDEVAAPEGTPVELTVVTSYGVGDGNRSNYEYFVKMYEESTGNTVRDLSGISNEEWKSRIMADFEAGAEPDILFFFTGSSSNSLIAGDRVVPIDEIRSVYPEYARNINDNLLHSSPVDGKQYAVPVNTYWEGLFVNKAVLADCGVEVPGADTTWEQFMADCETILENGYIPIAASLREVPHYWFEFCVFNHTSVDTHPEIPESSLDKAGRAWIAGLNDITAMYLRGFFPDNTTIVTDPEMNMLMIKNEAAFMLDGSWKVGWFLDNADNIDDITVTYVPAKGGRIPTDIIGGLSMGYYITRKAWDNPDKQAACVEFVSAMTSDEAIMAFDMTSLNANAGTVLPEGTATLVRDAIEMTAGATAIVPAVQDDLPRDASAYLFKNVRNIVTGFISADDVLDMTLGISE